jgi:hypothetical protein
MITRGTAVVAVTGADVHDREWRVAHASGAPAGEAQQRVAYGPGVPRSSRMIPDVDDSLRRLIERDALEGSDVEVVFDAPNRDWAARRSVPTVDVFLYDIREDVSRRDVAPQIVRDGSGRVVERRLPPRRFRLSYLLTAWTQRPEDEHRLLAQLLGTLLRHDAIPEDLVSGDLHDLAAPVVLELALPPGPDRSLTDIWSALGGELKPSLDLVVVAPIDPSRRFSPAPPVLEEPSLRLGRVGQADGGEDVHRGTQVRSGRTLRTRRTAAPRP